MILIKDLVKDYGKEEITHALKGVNLSLPNSGLISILGPSGCGKSTLLNLIGLLDTPTSGDILINDISTKDLSSKEQDVLRNKTIGFIFQSYHLIPTLSILDNVTLPLDVDKKLTTVNKKEKAKELLAKFGLNDLNHKKTNELSGGQKQRVAIARALINDPEVILADEPTGALDSENSEEVLKILKEISKEKLVIMVTHNDELAKSYSDEIIHMKDGEIVSIDKINKIKDIKNKDFEVVEENHKVMMPQNIIKISTKSFMSKKLKTILTSVANCFGLVALGFVLSITNGFTIYKNKVDAQSASNLPINVPSYSIKTETESWKDINQTTEYPKTDEIYPFVDANSKVTYTYNNFSSDYFELLDDLVKEGLASEYLFNYGNSYSYNLTTEYPASLDEKNEGYVDEVETSLSAGGSYANSNYGIPTNIFHVLYGDIKNGYDLIYGEMPKSKTDLVLVVNEYNSINFSTLQNLGFYNLTDTQEEVMNSRLDSKVKPISFKDIVGKKYKIFSNDEIFVKTEFKTEINDLFAYKFDTPLPHVSTRNISIYDKNDYKTIFEDPSKGLELKISGIIRPKKDSTISLLGPSLCYVQELQDDLIKNRKESEIANKISDNVVYLSDEPKNNLDIVNDFNKLLRSHNNNISEISTTEVNKIADKYFRYYYIDDGYYHEYYPDQFRYTTFSNFLTYAKKIGADLVDQETKNVISSGNQEDILIYIKKVLGYFKSVTTKDLAYKHFISLTAFMNTYSDITNIAIFPIGLHERSLILNRLDEFNDSRVNEIEKIYYLDAGNFMIETVGDMVSLISLVLLIFVAVLVIVACVMNILFTYNNVLERRKDIGIFRAIGMKKIDVSRIFIFESLIVGFLSGVMSVILTFALEFPVNYAVKIYYDYVFNIGNICVMTWWHVIVLILLGIILGMTSAIIPSYQAANKDPVECLKDE